MRQLKTMRKAIVTTNSSETTNSLTINKQSSNDTDKILNIKCESTNDISTINTNTFSPANLFRTHKNGFNCGLINKLYKIRIFFANLIHKSSNSSENSSNETNNNGNYNNNKLHNNLNDSSMRHHSKYYSIALNLIHGDQGIYENAYCTCRNSTNSNNKEEKICMSCLASQGKFQKTKESFKNSNKQLTGIMAIPSQAYSMANKSSLEYDSDLLNSTTLTPQSLTLIQNPNYVLYDIPELDETDDNLNEVEYYYNRTEKI